MSKRKRDTTRTLADLWGKKVAFIRRQKEEHPDWTFLPDYLDRNLVSFRQLYEQVFPLCHEYHANIHGKQFEARRISCKFSSPEHQAKIAESTEKVSQMFSYNKVQWYSWEDCPLLVKIKQKLEHDFNVVFSYCLVHIYRDSKDTLGYHCDSEALNTPVASVSLGATRKFRFRKMDGTNAGYDHEYELQDGDLLWMKPTCQRKWVHSLIPQSDPTIGARINLTFRLWDR